MSVIPDLKVGHFPIRRNESTFADPDSLRPGVDWGTLNSQETKIQSSKFLIDLQGGCPLCRSSPCMPAHWWPQWERLIANPIDKATVSGLPLCLRLSQLHKRWQTSMTQCSRRVFFFLPKSNVWTVWSSSNLNCEAEGKSKPLTTRKRYV